MRAPTHRPSNTMKSFTVVAMLGAVFIAALALHLDGPAADSWSCAGSALCRGLPQSDCDAAIETPCQIQPNNRIFTGGNKGATVVCSLGPLRPVRVGVQLLRLDGNEMIVAFDELRSRNCQKCGIKTYNDRYKFTAEYVTGC